MHFRVQAHAVLTESGIWAYYLSIEEPKEIAIFFNIPDCSLLQLKLFCDVPDPVLTLHCSS
jgi:hypothetical protein